MVATNAVLETPMSKHMMPNFRCSVIHLIPISTQREEKSLNIFFPSLLHPSDEKLKPCRCYDNYDHVCNCRPFVTLSKEAATSNKILMRIITL